METKRPVEGTVSETDDNFITPAENFDESLRRASSSESEEHSNSTHPNHTLPQQEAVDDTEEENQKPKHPATPTEKKKAEDKGIKKHSMIQRVFTEDDELSLLEGVYVYRAKKGTDPYGDIVNFHKFIKEESASSQQLKDVSSKQLKEKIRRLKRKYVRKCRENPVMFKKTHDLKLFELSKKIWECETANVNEESKKEKAAGGSERRKMVNLREKFPLCAEGLMEVDASYCANKLELIEMGKLEKYESKLKKIKLDELQLYIQKREVTNQMLGLLCDASKHYQ